MTGEERPGEELPDIDNVATRAPDSNPLDDDLKDAPATDVRDAIDDQN